MNYPHMRDSKKYSFNILSLHKPKRDPCGALRLGFARSAKGFDPQNFDFAQDDTLDFCCAVLFALIFVGTGVPDGPKTKRFVKTKFL